MGHCHKPNDASADQLQKSRGLGERQKSSSVRVNTCSVILKTIQPANSYVALHTTATLQQRIAENAKLRQNDITGLLLQIEIQ